VAGVFKAAVRDRRIVANPCEGTKLPKVEHRKVVPPTTEQGEAIAAAMPAPVGEWLDRVEDAGQTIGAEGLVCRPGTGPAWRSALVTVGCVRLTCGNAIPTVGRRRSERDVLRPLCVQGVRPSLRCGRSATTGGVLLERRSASFRSGPETSAGIAVSGDQGPLMPMIGSRIGNTDSGAQGSGLAAADGAVDQLLERAEFEPGAAEDTHLLALGLCQRAGMLCVELVDEADRGSLVEFAQCHHPGEDHGRARRGT
jgi:hypothetical protein